MPQKKKALQLSFPLPAETLEFSGERYVSGITGQIQSEHYHRYLFAAEFCSGRNVFDIASGEGYGCHLLAQVANKVIGGDRDAQAVGYARKQYRASNLDFIVCEAHAVPLASSSADVVTSFETIEHVDNHEAFLAEVRRVLRPTGLFIVSSPNRPVYNEMNKSKNPFHKEELDREEFRAALLAHFPNVRIFEQRAIDGSVIALEGAEVAGVSCFESANGRDYRLSSGLPFVPYFVALASDSSLPRFTNSLCFNNALLTGLQFDLETEKRRVVEARAELDDWRKELVSEKSRTVSVTDLLTRTERELQNAKERSAKDESELAQLKKELAFERRRVRSLNDDLSRHQATSDSLKFELEATAALLAKSELELVSVREALTKLKPKFSLKRTAGPPAAAKRASGTSHPQKLRALLRHPTNSSKRKAYRARHSLPVEMQANSSPPLQNSFSPASGDRPATLIDPVYQNYSASSTQADAEHCELCTDSIQVGEAEPKVIAYYLPQFHPIPENDQWWGKGFTEWRNVNRAFPVYEGHYQPRIPGELGYYDLRVVDTIRQQVNLAKRYGITAFCFYFYWFGGKRLLELPLQKFLEAKDIDFQFSLCWANENWSRRWDGGNNHILIAQQHSADDDLAFIRYVARYFSDHRYLKVDGKPVLTVYRPSAVPNVRETLRHWREEARKMGFPGLYLISTNAFNFNEYQDAGFDASSEFPPNFGKADKIDEQFKCSPLRKGGSIFSYEQIVKRELDQANPEGMIHPGAMPSWDNSARRPYDATIFHGARPALFRQWLKRGFERAAAHPPGQRFLFINAWNEWAEGAYLEPDAKFGYAWLQAVRDARLEARSVVSKARRGLVVVSHDAHPHGAQYLALACARQAAALGFSPEIILLDGGPLISHFERIGRVHFISPARDSEQKIAKELENIRLRSLPLAIVNSTVSGSLVKPLNKSGFTTLTLVHELPGVLSSYQLEAHARDIADHSHEIVFPAKEVKDGFERFAGRLVERAIVTPQGVISNVLERAKGDVAADRRTVRSQLNISPEAKIILGVAYGDFRKGFDLFVDACIDALLEDDHAVAVWIGKHEQQLFEEQLLKIKSVKLEDRFIFTGHIPELEPFYLAADVFVLSSREDPFPNVVLDSLGAGIPVVGFEGAGGFSALLKRGCGVLVPMCDSRAMAAAILQLLRSPAQAMAMGRIGNDIVNREYRFQEYFQRLLASPTGPLPSVSVVVPNFNYARYILDRLASIVGQSVEPLELIVLDDASDDNSATLIRQFLDNAPIPVRFVANTQNSGSVFKQWRKGVDLARGEIVWIAEADDLADADFLSELLPSFSRSDVVMSYCQSRQIDSDGNLLSGDYLDYVADVDRVQWVDYYLRSGREEIAEALYMKNTIPNVSAVLFKREPLQRIFSEHEREITSFRFAGDWISYIRLLEKGAISFSPRALNSHRRHQRSVTIGNYGMDLLREIIEVQRSTIARHSLSAHALQRANQYIQKLYEQFGLASSNYPHFELNPSLRTIRAAA